MAGNDRAAFWSWEWQEAMDTNNLNTARLLRVTTFMALLEIILMMGSCTGLPCSSHKRIPTLRVCSLKHEIPVIRTWFETTARLRFSHKNARPRDASGSCPATLQWKPSRSAISAWSPQVVFLKQPFQEGIQADSPWGENSLGFPSQYPRDSITGPIIYCCAAGYSNAQRSIPTTIFISQDLESRIWEGLCWVLLAVCTR